VATYPGGVPNLKSQAQIEAAGADGTSNDAVFGIPKMVGDANDEIEAIATELGVNPSGASATVVARLDALDTTVGAKETPAGATSKASAAQSAAEATAAAALTAHHASTSADHDDRYYTEAEVDAAISTAINALIDGAPGALDTLNELAAAMADDAAFSASVTNALAGKIDKSTIDANSILYGITDNVPAALAVPASRLVARLASGDVKAATPAEVKALLAILGSEVAVSGFNGNLNGATSVQAALDLLDDATLGGAPADGSITNAKLATVATGTFKGRVASGTGAPADLTTAQVTKQLGVDALQDAFVNGQAFTPEVMTSPPTLALSAASAATTISGSATIAPNSSVFTYLGASMSNIGTVSGFTNCYRQNTATLTYSSPPYLLNVEFETDTDTFEIIVKSENSTASRILVWVDGQPTSATPQLVGTSGSYYRLKVTFPAAAARRIRIEGQYVTFMGIAKHPSRTMWATTRDLGPKAVIVGDSSLTRLSWTDTGFGTIADYEWWWGSWAVQAGRYLGWNVYPSGVGGTGYLADFSGTEVNYGSRFTANVANLSPDIVVFSGGLNDRSLTLSSVQSAINSLFSACASALPSATVYALAPFSPLNTYDSNLNTIAGYISTAASANGFTYVSGCVDWVDGTGKVTSTTGVGNSDYYTSGDEIHLTAAGQLYLGERFVGAVGANIGRKPKPVRLVVPLLYSVGKECVVENDVFRWYNKTGRTLTVDAVYASIGTAPTGSSLIVDVKKNGTTLFTTTGNRPTISASGFVSTTTLPDVRTVADGDYLTFDVLQVGSTIKGSYLNITVMLSAV